MASLLSDDKQTHLAHVVLKSLQETSEVRIVGDSTMALREIKRVLTEQMKMEQEIDHSVRFRLQSYSRPIPEGSQEWEVMYHKAYTEELRKRKLE